MVGKIAWTPRARGIRPSRVVTKGCAFVATQAAKAADR
jgi:hypothetical protein